MKRRDFLAATGMTSIAGIPVKAIETIHDGDSDLKDMPKEVDVCIASYMRSQRMSELMTQMGRKLEDRGMRAGRRRFDKHNILFASEEYKGDYPFHSSWQEGLDLDNDAHPKSHWHGLPGWTDESNKAYNSHVKGIFHMNLFQLMEMLCEWKAEHEDRMVFSDASEYIRAKCKELDLDSMAESWLLRTAMFLNWA